MDFKRLVNGGLFTTLVSYNTHAGDLYIKIEKVTRRSHPSLLNNSN